MPGKMRTDGFLTPTNSLCRIFYSKKKHWEVLSSNSLTWSREGLQGLSSLLISNDSVTQKRPNVSPKLPSYQGPTKVKFGEGAQPLHSCHLGLDNSLFGSWSLHGWCLAESLVSTHLMPASHHTSCDSWKCFHSLSQGRISEFCLFVLGPLWPIPQTHLSSGEEEAAFSAQN